jgi:hypothetical protein
MVFFVVSIFWLCVLVFCVLWGLWIILTVIGVLLSIWISLLKFAIWLVGKDPAPLAMPEEPAPQGDVIDLRRDEWHYVE